MHTIRCPNCQKTFSVPTPVVHARVRCSNCQNVFVATSQETPSVARPAAPPAQPAHPAWEPPRPGGQPARPGGQPPPSRVVAAQVRKKGSRMPVIIVAVCLVGLVAVGIGAWVLSGTEVIEVSDQSHPGVFIKKRVSKAEAQRIRDERAAKDAQEKEAKDKRAAAAAQRQAEVAAEISRSFAPPSIPDTSNQSATSAPTAMYSEPTDISVKDDAALRIGTMRVVPSPVDPATGDVTGYATNPSDNEVTESAQIIVWFNNEKKQPVHLCSTVIVTMIPPRESIPFSQHFRAQYTPPLLATIEKVQKAPKGTVAWILPTDIYEVTRKGTQIIYSNKLKDPFSYPVRDVKVYLSAFSEDGVQVGQTKIVDLPGRDLWPDREKDIEIAIDDPNQEQSVIAKWVARAVGTGK